MSRGSVVAVQRGEPHELQNTSVPPKTVTVWSNNIFGLASCRMSVNQTVPHVLNADMGDLGLGGRGSLMPRFGSLRIGANGRVPVSSGFRVMSFRRRPCERRAQLMHRVLQLPNCRALSC